MAVRRSDQSVLLESDALLCVFNLAAGGIERLVAKMGGEERQLAGGDGPTLPVFRLHWGQPVQQPARPPVGLRRVGEAASVSLVHADVDEAASAVRAAYEVTDAGCKARVTISVALGPQGDELLISGEVENGPASGTIREVILPVLWGVRLSDDAEEESLLYPFFSGVRIDGPRRALLQGRTEPAVTEPLTPSYDEAGSCTVRHLYCGQLSMPWLTVTRRTGGGVALIHYDPEYEVTALAVGAAAAPGGVAEGLDLAAGKVRPIAPGERRTLPPTGILVYSGTWHAAADRYRAWTERRRFLPPRVPDWVRTSHALTAHYDFKWEDGTHHHTFADIPELYRRTAREGITHLFMAGWFVGGFDHMYPEFYPDLELGTVMDFIDAVRTVREEGGKATFYINATLFGRASRYFPTLGEEWAVRGPDGKTVDWTFFGQKFVTTCRGSKGYQRLIRDTVRWLVGEVGASGVYLDTFAAMGPYLCFAPGHGHPHPAHWNRDAVATLRTVEDAVRRANPDAFTMVEGCGDLYGQWVVAHLIHGWAYPHTEPAMFRYTFPEYVTVDMVYPSRGQSFRPPHISAQAYDQLHRTFVYGSLLWVYDQEDDRFCNFRSDPEMWAYVKRILALRERGVRYFGYGRFRDAVGLVGCDDALVVKRFDPRPETGQFAPDDLAMLAVWNRTGGKAVVTVRQGLLDAWQVRPDAVRLAAWGVDGALDVAGRAVAGGLELTLPPAATCLVFLHRA